MNFEYRALPQTQNPKTFKIIASSTQPNRQQRLLHCIFLIGASAAFVTGNSAIATEIMAGSCPLLVAPSNSEFQPKRIQPTQVAAKNAAGCLSPADAIYGPDGCPRKLCGANSGVIPLPGS